MDLLTFLVNGGACLLLIVLAMLFPTLVQVTYPLQEEKGRKESLLDLLEMLNSGIKNSVCSRCGKIYSEEDCDEVMVSHGICDKCRTELYGERRQS